MTGTRPGLSMGNGESAFSTAVSQGMRGRRYVIKWMTNGEARCRLERNQDTGARNRSNMQKCCFVEKVARTRAREEIRRMPVTENVK